MKITKSQLESIIREELETVKELGGTFTLQGAEELKKKYNLTMPARALWDQHKNDAHYDVEQSIKAWVRRGRPTGVNELFGRGEKKQSVPYADSVSFDWGDSGMSMVMSADGKGVLQFSSQKEVKDLISQLEELLQGPMRTSG